MGTVIEAGVTMVGGLVSVGARTVTENVACDWLLCASVAVHVTVVLPTGNVLPDAGVHASDGELST